VLTLKLTFTPERAFVTHCGRMCANVQSHLFCLDIIAADRNRIFDSNTSKRRSHAPCRRPSPRHPEVPGTRYLLRLGRAHSRPAGVPHRMVFPIA